MQIVAALEVWLSWQFELDLVVVADSSFSQEVGGLQLVWVVMIVMNSSDVMMMNLAAALSPSCL